MFEKAVAAVSDKPGEIVINTMMNRIAKRLRITGM